MFSSYRAVNTLCLGYKKRTVNTELKTMVGCCEIIKRERQYKYIVIIRGVRVTTATVEKTIRIKYKDSVPVALITRHAKRMRRITLPSVACLALLDFTTLSHKRDDFRKNEKITEHKICVLIIYTFV